MTAPVDLDAIASEFLQQCGPHDCGVIAECRCAERDHRPTMLALIAEVERLRAVVDQVQALADSARENPSAPPADDTLAIVAHWGGHQDLDRVERVYVRSDRGAAENLGEAFPDGDWWLVSDPAGDDAKPLTWGELNWLDDPWCDRGSVAVETYVSVDALDAALSGPAKAAQS